MAAVALTLLTTGCLEETEVDGDAVDGGSVEPDGAPAVDAAPEPEPDAEPATDMAIDRAVDAAVDAAPPPADALEWGPCPRQIPRAGDPTCAVVDVPLQWDAPDGPTIELMTLRYAAGPDPVGQLWLLDGGPGGSGSAFAEYGLIDDFAPAGYEIFVPMHRGTGLSTPLACDEPRFGNRLEEVLRDCGETLQAEWGDGLAGFRASEAGRDLGHLIERVDAVEGGRTMVYGISYGTYWALRYLRAFPEQADGVILDGILDLQAEVWLNGAMAEGVGDHLMNLCAGLPGCNSAFDEAPRDAVETAFARAADGTCPPLAGIPSEELAGLMGLLIAIGDETRPLVPGFMARAARCNDQDAEELAFFLDAVFDNLFGGGFRRPAPRAALDWPRNRFQQDLEFNNALYFAVLMADLIPPWRLDPVDVFEASADLRFNGPPDNPEAMLAAWPAIDQIEDHTAPPQTDIPLLMTQGLLDVQTVPPWADRAAAALAGPGQTLVTFPYGGHGAVTGNLTTDGDPCGRIIMLGFLADPGAPLETGCLDALEPLDLAGERPDTQGLSEFFFGTPALMPGG